MATKTCISPPFKEIIMAKPLLRWTTMSLAAAEFSQDVVDGAGIKDAGIATSIDIGTEWPAKAAVVAISISVI
jgi:hypothetical protein